MNKICQPQVLALFLIALQSGASFAVEPNQTTTTSLDTVKIEQLTGAKGKLDAKENVFKVTVPRSDLKVSIAGVKMTPAAGLTSWAAFTPSGDQVMVMGDIVLLEDQINPVISTALENGIEVTALHNHFLWDTPKVMFMHIAASGHVENLATGIGQILAKVQETQGGVKPAAKIGFDAAKTSLDPKPIETIIGTAAEKTGDIYKVTLGRTTQMNGHSVGKSMGVNTWAAFAGSDEKAIVEGDFAMLESELQAVLKALRDAGINITSIHHHMANETPKIVFLHYWGAGTVSDLAKAVKTALDTQTKS